MADFSGVGILNCVQPDTPEFASLSDGKQTRKIIEDHGLTCPSAHFDMKELRTKQAQLIDWAKDIGMTQMGTASLGGRAPGGVTMDVVKAAADEYNKIGETAAKSGIQQFLHDEDSKCRKWTGG